MRSFRLTLIFVIVSVVVIAGAAIVVNLVIGGLAEDNLIRIAEENTARDAVHIQSMMRRGHSMDGMPSVDGVLRNWTVVIRRWSRDWTS